MRLAIFFRVLFVMMRRLVAVNAVAAAATHRGRVVASRCHGAQISIIASRFSLSLCLSDYGLIRCCFSVNDTTCSTVEIRRRNSFPRRTIPLKWRRLIRAQPSRSSNKKKRRDCVFVAAGARREECEKVMERASPVVAPCSHRPPQKPTRIWTEGEKVEGNRIN